MSRIRLFLLTTACLTAVGSHTNVEAQSQQPVGPPAPPTLASPPPASPPPASPAAGLNGPASGPAQASPSAVTTRTPTQTPRGHSLSGRSPAAAKRGAPGAGDVITAIKVTGNERIEQGTIESYMLIQPGDRADPDRIDRSLKTLFATGLFKDVTINRDGSTLVVKVVENPLINRVLFDGNHAIVDDTLRPLLELRPRSVFTPDLARADRQKILDAYAKKGRFGATVEPKIIRLPQNRVDVVFEINDGTATLISRITFVNNHAFGEDRLREVVNSRQEAWYRFLSSSDTYDPARVEFDRELLRRFYLKNGYADFEVKDATAELAPDRSAFFLTFTLNEGAQYRVTSISVTSALPKLEGATLLPFVQQQKGEIYDGDAIERSVDAIQDAAQARGYNFVLVRPRIARDREKHTVDLVFDVTEGPRIYVERIDIEGNTRTEDKVIRRELQFAEGDAYNPAAIRKSRTRLTDLGYFNTVNITQAPGSTSDKALVNVAVDEKATGELSFGGGFSTDAGALISAGLREKNLVGTGIDSSLNGTLAQRRSEINLSATDPYFLDRNLVAGFDIFDINNNNQAISNYNESRIGASLRTGYEINDHLRQAITYSIVERNINDVNQDASLYILNSAGGSLLSQIGQTLTLDYRDSRVEPHSGFIVRYGVDFAGLGGTSNFIRNKLDTTYYIPLDRVFGSSDWGIAISASGGYLDALGKQENIIDRFFLGGDNLRGFQSGGAGPHTIPTTDNPNNTSTQIFPGDGAVYGSDSVGGRIIYTQSTEFRFPLPISADLGLTGRSFVDLGGLADATTRSNLFAYNFNGVAVPGGITQTLSHPNSLSPRVGAGFGVSWKTPFGLINIDIADPVVKQKYDQTQIFRFGFGTRF